MTKFSITKLGIPLDPSLYTWDEETKTLITRISGLVLDFSGLDGCTFETESFCTFKTGKNCTFITGHGCIFKTGENCKFKTGSYCTFGTRGYCTFKTSNHCTFRTGCNCTFETSYNCYFITGWGCTFKTGDSCTFETESCCTFKTGSRCTFKTGSDCNITAGNECRFISQSSSFTVDRDCIFFDPLGSTFYTEDRCTIIYTHSIYPKEGIPIEMIDISNVEGLKTLEGYPGYIKDGYYYRNNEKQYPAVLVDGILSEVIEHKGNVYKVRNYGKTEISYIVQDGDIYSHGKTVQEAKESLIYKISNRDTSQYKDYTLNTEVSKKEAIQMYRCITGACEHGTRMFVERLEEVPESLTIKEIIELTKGQYGNDTFRKFFEKE